MKQVGQIVLFEFPHIEWASFLGALMGAVIGALAIVGIMALWIYVSDRRAEQGKTGKRLRPLESVLESHLEQHIVEHFGALFPGWKIFDAPPEGKDQFGESHRPSGIRYRTSAGEIDILAIDRQENLVVIELKRGRAPDRVIAQVDRYIAWVKQHLARPGQTVRGIIIAKSVSNRLTYTLSRRRGIRVWTYGWQLRLDKQPIGKDGVANPKVKANDGSSGI